MADGDPDGIDLGDLPEILERVAAEQDDAERRADDDIIVTPVYDGFCAHTKGNINHGMRALTCRECGADLDPFDFLNRLAGEANRWKNMRIDLQRRAQKAQDVLEETLRLERNARARLARLERKEKGE